MDWCRCRSGRRILLSRIKEQNKKEFPEVKIVRDRTKFTKDWNDELKYLFSKGYRYENYINPNEMVLKIMEEEMKALANSDMKTVQEKKAYWSNMEYLKK